ncbi:MAG: type IV toxin-antitoxin system AbiEi family antitoxin domain-containing protein, partial [Actinomycetota bacterium]|nr:type IV toxin-antitoxin system AbiEi family antitoxin domain-containing protein [Actinomycetota bacterium]
MKVVDTELLRRAAGQHAVVLRRQAMDLGMTSRQVQTRIGAGLIVPVHRGVYRMAGSVVSPEQDLRAACLAAGRGAVASHRGAAWLWSLRGFDNPAREITVRGGQPSLPGIVVHRSSSLGPVDVSRTRCVPVTTPARTIFDLGAVVEVEAVECAMEDALLRRLVTFEVLSAAVRRLGGRGRPGSSVVRRLLAERDPAAAPTESVLEDDLLRVLRRAGLPEPVRQHRVGGVRLDFAYPTVR